MDPVRGLGFPTLRKFQSGHLPTTASAMSRVPVEDSGSASKRDLTWDSEGEEDSYTRNLERGDFSDDDDIPTAPPLFLVESMLQPYSLCSTLCRHIQDKEWQTCAALISLGNMSFGWLFIIGLECSWQSSGNADKARKVLDEAVQHVQFSRDLNRW